MQVLDTLRTRGNCSSSIISKAETLILSVFSSELWEKEPIGPEILGDFFKDTLDLDWTLDPAAHVRIDRDGHYLTVTKFNPDRGSVAFRQRFENEPLKFMSDLIVRTLNLVDPEETPKSLLARKMNV